MIDYQIQRAQPTDWQRIRSIRLRSLADAPDAFGTTLAEDQTRPDVNWRDRAENDGVVHFLATTRDGNDLGIVVGSPYSGYKNTAGLFGMWVAPESRGQRVGNALVRAVIQWARNEKYRRIILDVADTNTVAIRLYESSGFVATGTTGSLPPPRQHISEHERCLNLA